MHPGGGRAAARRRRQRRVRPHRHAPTAPQRRPPPTPILSVNNIEVIYDHVILVLKGVSLAVPKGGSSRCSAPTAPARSTTLKAISNLLRAERGEVTKGSIEFDGERVDALTPERAGAARRASR